MVVRPKLHWLRMLFVLKGSVLPRIAPQLIFTTVLAIVVTWLHGYIGEWKVSLNFVPFSLIGLTLAIFLGFRNSTAYARYWEARTLWGVMLTDTRTLAQLALSVNRDPATARPLIERLCAMAHALRHQLRGSDARADLQHFLPPAECERVFKARFPTSMALLLAHEWLGDRLRAGQIEAAVVPAFASPLAKLSLAFGGCERIASNPIPFTYAVIIHRCMYLYCWLLPFGLLDTIGLMTPVIVCFIAYTFFALEALGAELEEPFGTEINDLPLSAMCHTIETSLLEMLGEAPRTERPIVRDYVLN